MSSRENTLKFILCEESSRGEGLLEKTYNEAKSRDLQVQILSPTDILNEDLKNDKSLFVMDVFSGECFDSLVSQKRRVFGPLCILRCFEKQIPLPNVYHPVYSLAMHGVVVSCTSVSRAMRDKLYPLVERMGGRIAKDFTSAVTHLVAGEVGSNKYSIACKMKKVVVLPRWIEEAWVKTQGGDFDANDPEFISAHLCPIFKGCTICLTGIDLRKRKEIQAAVEKHGGTYLPDLKLKVTTHLLVEKPVGNKYEFAVRWNVHCVHPDWLNECIEAGHWLDETPFIVQAKRDLNRTRSVGGELSITTINATALNNTANVTVSKAAEAAQRSSESHGHKDIFRETRTSRTQRGSMSADQSNGDFDYNVTIPSTGDMFLDGCKIYLSGFVGRKLEQLQKIINAGGATRFNQLNDGVTHVVMGEKLVKDVDMLTKAEITPHVVTARWLLDCCSQVKCLTETEYYCMEIPNVEDAMPEDTSSKQQLNQSENKPDPTMDDDVLCQYLDLMKDDVGLHGLDDKMADVETDQNETTHDNADADKKPDEASEDSMTSEPVQDLLSQITIEIKGFTEEQELELQDAIESRGGVVVKEPDTAQFAILPVNYECESCTADVMVTSCWLERSIECGAVLEPSSNFMFKPFSLAEDVFPLTDCVISISQYSGVERDHLTRLAEMLGARYQEYFSRRDDGNYLPNTHLLLQEPLGSKYEAAVRWEIPAVTAQWLFQCARTGTKVPEGPYLVDKEQCVDEVEVIPQLLGDKVATSAKHVYRDAINNNIGTNVQKSDKYDMKAPCDIPKGRDSARKDTTKWNVPEGVPSLNKPPAGFGRPEKPSFDLTDALEVLQSPCCSSGSSSNQSRLSRGSRGSFLMDEYIQEHMQAALRNTSKLPRTTSGTTEQVTEPSKYNMSEVKKQAPEPAMFLAGVVLHVSKKLVKQQVELHNIASSVGADFRWTLDDACTHLVHEGRLTKEHTQAKNKGVFIVSPHWLHECIEEQCRVDESLFPASYNPKLTLSVVKTRKSERSTSENKSETKREEVDVLAKPSEETNQSDKQRKEPVMRNGRETCGSSTTDHDQDEVADERKHAGEAHVLSQESTQSDSMQTREEIKHIKGLTQAMKSTRRRSRRVTSTNNSGSHSGESAGELSKKPSRRQSSRLRSLRSGQDNNDDEEDEDHPVETITYDDPKSRLERERIIAQLSSCSPTNINDNVTSTGYQQDETLDMKQIEKIEAGLNDGTKTPVQVVIKHEEMSPTHTPTPAAPPIALQVTSSTNIPEPVSLLEPAKQRQSYKFLMSAMSQQEKIDYAALIEELGGQVFDNQYFNPICSHTIVGQLNRNEKCLASIAAGNWVLHKSFLESSRIAGHFVNEEDHEWGVEVPGEPLTSLACAARRWRMTLTKASQKHKSKYGAFQNWKVLLCVEQSKLQSFQRMLEAGGAKVVDTTPPFSNITGVTHAFISRGKASPVDNVNIERLENADILVLRTDYIANYLTDDPAPPTNNHVFRRTPVEATTSRKRKPNEDLSEVTEKRQRKY